MSDYKYEMQLLAEQAAEDKYGKDFSELSPTVQDELYRRAMDDWHDQRAEQADTMRDAARDAAMGI
jgi:hypothetical protein